MKCLAGYKCTEEQDIRRAIQLLQPSESSLFIDVGSGEGQVLLFAARSTGCQCLGLENDESLVAVSSKAVSAATTACESLSSRITILKIDAETFDFQSQQDFVVYMFLSHFGYAIMGDVLLSQCPLNTRIVTVANPIDHPFWVPKCVWLGNDNCHDGTMNLYLYIVDEIVKQRCESAKNISQSSSQSLLESQSCPAAKSIHSQWIHPPPGSYLPRHVPHNTPTFPASTNAEEIQAFVLLKGQDAVTAASKWCSQPSTNTHALQSKSMQVVGPTTVGGLPAAVSLLSRGVASPPQPPPLPPPLPSLPH